MLLDQNSLSICGSGWCGGLGENVWGKGGNARGQEGMYNLIFVAHSSRQPQGDGGLLRGVGGGRMLALWAQQSVTSTAGTNNCTIT